VCVHSILYHVLYFLSLLLFLDNFNARECLDRKSIIHARIAQSKQQLARIPLSSSTSLASLVCIMNVAQRRGKGVEPKSNTVLVAEAPAAESDPLTLPDGRMPVAVATVRRRFCGTGPFDHHWLNLDCCGLLCALLTYMLHLYAIYAVTMVLIPPWMSYDAVKNAENGDAVVGQLLTQSHNRIISWAGVLHRICFTLIAALAIVSHWKAMTTDPGSVPPDAQPIGVTQEDETPLETKLNSPEKSQTDGADPTQVQNYLLEPPSIPKVKRICRRCKSYKPSRAHHCSICRRCIIKMDHHCPWVNNCVGIGNHKYFLLFVFYTCLSCAYSLILIVSRFAACSGDGIHAHARSSRLMRQQRDHSHPFCLDRPSHLLIVICLLLEALLFGMFTACMMMDQADVVRSKVTHIDRFTGADVGSNALSGVLEVFGVGPGHRSMREARFRPDWLSPFVQVCFPSASLRDEVVGYCRPCVPNHSKKEGPSESWFDRGIRSGNALRWQNRNKNATSMVEII
jgi:palmitoyltransferase ZDHHC3/7/25